MNNEWLKRKEKKQVNRKTVQDLDKIVRNWQETGTGADKIQIILNGLADRVIDYLKPDLNEVKKAEATEEMIAGCLMRLGRINVDKSRSFNYFTTIMCAILRQLTVTRKDMKALKEQHREYIASRNRRARGQR